MPIYLKKDLPIKSNNSINFISKINRHLPHVKVGILNLMPTLEETEEQLLKALDTPLLQVEVIFIYLTCKNKNLKTQEYYQKYYTNYQKISSLDGLIVTGSPLEHLNYLNITYIDELKNFLNFTKTHVKTSLFLCWASEFALEYFYGVNRYLVSSKHSGLYLHYLVNKSLITKDFPDYFYVPQSRYCNILESDVLKIKDLKLISKSNPTGIFILESIDKSKVFATGHLEYSLKTLDYEYKRDLKKGLKPPIPKNYYPKDNPEAKPINSWSPITHLFYHNWLYYYVYLNKS